MNIIKLSVVATTVMIAGSLLIYGILLLLVSIIPSLSAAQILPQYPVYVVLWIGICLVGTLIQNKHQTNKANSKKKDEES